MKFFKMPDIDLIYANGCSWTYGDGIRTDPMFSGTRAPEHTEQPNYSWPKQLANIIGCEVINDGQGAGSNQRMVRRTCQFLKDYPADKRKNLLVIIGWSSLERDEIMIEHDGNERWLNFNSGQDIDTQFLPYPEQMILELKRYQNIHRQFIQNTYIGFMQWMNQMYLLSNTLQNLQVRYLFFSSIGGWRWGNNYGIDLYSIFAEELKAFDDPRYLGMVNGESMARFCDENGIPLSRCLHPMVEGHRRWAEFLHKALCNIYF